MSTVRRKHFDSPITFRGKQYRVNMDSSIKGRPAPVDSLKLIESNPRLKGKTDLHGNPYKPSIYYFKQAI